MMDLDPREDPCHPDYLGPLDRDYRTPDNPRNLSLLDPFWVWAQFRRSICGVAAPARPFRSPLGAVVQRDLVDPDHDVVHVLEGPRRLRRRRGPRRVRNQRGRRHLSRGR